MHFPRLALAFCILTVAAVADVTWPDADALPAASFPHAATKEIAIGHDIVIPAKFELTEKGNGGLTIPGFGIRVYDASRDGVTYRGFLLNCEWKDTNADGYLDLVVSGTAEIWNKEGDNLEMEKPVTAVFTYSPAKRAFTLVQCPLEIYHWENRATVPARPTTPEK